MAHIPVTKGVFTDALSVTTNVTSDATVTIGDITYKFEATPAAAYDVDVGADADVSAANLISAINADGDGDAYFTTGTLVNPYVSAEQGSDLHIIDLTARLAGSWVNGLYVAASTTDVVVESVTFGLGANTGQVDGVGDLNSFVDDLIARNQLNSEVLTALRALTPEDD